jgi:hypothetical protein
MDASYCPKCGTAVQPGNRFCIKCGAELAARPTSRPEGRPRKQVRTGKPAQPRRSPPSRPATTRATGLAKRASSWGQRVWDVITMGGCSVLAGLWYWYSGMAETEPDLKTCATTVLLPLALIVFRQPIDRVLAYIQPIRELIPALVRLGIGLATPLLVANYLYARGSSEFDFMFKTVLISTLASFVMLRNPAVPRTTALKGRQK